MALRVITIVTSILLALAPCASAEDSVKKAIFEDCDQALKDFSSRSVEEQSSLAEFLARVVALSTQSPTAPEAFAVAPGPSPAGDAARLSAPKSPELISGALWQTLDAKRELKAKRCALELLRGAGGLALHVLPELVATYSEQALSDEIAVGLEETVADIAERAHKQGSVPSSEQFSSIAAHVFSQRPLVARLIIQEFLDDGLPFVLRTLVTSSATKDEVLQYLSEADPGGALTMRAGVSLAAALPPEQLAQVIARIPLPSKALLTEFINDFVRLGKDPRYAATFLPLLGSACAALEGFAIDATQQNEMAEIPDLLSPGILTPEQATCLVSSNPTLGKKLLPLLSKESPLDHQRFALAISASQSTRLAPEVRDDLYARIRERAVDLQSELSLEALRALTNFEQFKAESIQAALTIFKALPTISDVSRRELTAAALLDLLNNTGLGREPNRFSPYIKPYLVSPAPPPLALQLATKIPQLEGSIVSLALQVPPSPKSVAALYAVTSAPTLLKRSIAGLIDLLRYPDVQSLSEKGLAVTGSAAVAPLRKAIAKPAWAPRSHALAVLVALKSASKAEASELASVLANREGCSFVTNHTSTICSLLAIHPSDSSLHANLTSAAHRCINEMSSPQLDEIVRCAPDIVLSASDAINSYISTHGDSPRLAPVVSLLQRQTPLLPQQIPLLAGFLERGTSETQSTLLPLASQVGGDSIEISRAVKNIVQSADQDSPLRLEAIKTLAARGERDFDWSGFIKDVIRTNGKRGVQPTTLEVISLLPAETVLADVVPALESDSNEKLVGGALVGAALGPKAVPIVSRLWHLREARSPMVRYVAILALLQINPLTPDMHGEVTKILVNRYFSIARQLPIKWSHTVAIVDMDRSAFGSLRKSRLDELLRSER